MYSYRSSSEREDATRRRVQTDASARAHPRSRAPESETRGSGRCARSSAQQLSLRTRFRQGSMATSPRPRAPPSIEWRSRAITSYPDPDSDLRGFQASPLGPGGTCHFWRLVVCLEGASTSIGLRKLIQRVHVHCSCSTLVLSNGRASPASTRDAHGEPGVSWRAYAMSGVSA